MEDQDDEVEYCECCGAKIERYVETPMKFKEPEPLEDLYLPPPPMPLLSQIRFSKA